MNNRVRWHMNVLAGAIALIGSVATLDAQALGLGRINVQSSLGEPLRAEIDIAEISADEAGSLRAGVASADAFKAAGLDYNLAVADMQISLQKRSDGRAYLRLSTNRPITEPFVDLILEANWASGRIVRDYTMLFDPPGLRSASAATSVAPTAPVLSRPATPAPSTARSGGGIPYSPASPPPASPAPPVAKAPSVKALAITATPAPAPRASTSGQQVAVKQGDTASKIAAQTKPASISLDQMLVALLRSNPEAFAGGNINRLKSGAVLTIPTADEAAATSGGEASRTIVAQSKDFNDFRRKLAEGVPASQLGNSTRQAGGKVEARVDDRKPAAATPDKLTLSKGAIQGKAPAEEQIAKERQSKEAATRVTELAKNIGDLNKIAGVPATSSAAATTAATASAAKAPVGVAVAKPGVLTVPAVPVPAASAAPAAPATSAASAAKPAVSASAPAVAAVAPAVIAASSPASSASPASAAASTATAPASATTAPAAAAASAPAAIAPVKKPMAVAPPPPPEPSFIDELTDSPFILPGFAGLLLLLAGLGFYRHKKRNNAGQVDSSFLESRLQPDSFFGASGGQRIDTSEGGATGSSLVYSPSQLDAAGDVDPVAEADVYLAYGRDLQAEEILKEAMRTNPGRVAIHAKLAEIYAKRRDAKAFEVVAMEAYNLTRAEGPEWAYIIEMGRDLDPGNPMYQPGGQPSQQNPGGAGAGFEAFGTQTIPQTIEPLHEAAAPVDFDLDLDFSIGDKPAAMPTLPLAPAPFAPIAPIAEQTVAMKTMPHDPIFDGLDMDFSTDTVSLNTVALKPSLGATRPAPTPPAEDPSLAASGLRFTLDEPPTAKPAPVPAIADSGMLEFDLGSLSLDLNDSPTTESPVVSSVLTSFEDPLETKFALAEEFRALGDKDGARALADEVVAEAQGSLKSKAQAFLNALS